MSWENAWQNGRTGWDAGAPVPVLLELIQANDLPLGRALVPGCGAGYDVFALAHPDRVVYGLDVAPTAAMRFHSLREAHGLTTRQVDILTTDFFSYEPEQPFDLIWDYTFLCAIDPEARKRWAEAMNRLLAPEGELITLIFPLEDYGAAGSPPYTLSPELVAGLLEPVFYNVSLTPVTRSHPGREGKEVLGRWKKR